MLRPWVISIKTLCFWSPHEVQIRNDLANWRSNIVNKCAQCVMSVYRCSSVVSHMAYYWNLTKVCARVFRSELNWCNESVCSFGDSQCVKDGFLDRRRSVDHTKVHTLGRRWNRFELTRNFQREVLFWDIHHFMVSSDSLQTVTAVENVKYLRKVYPSTSSWSTSFYFPASFLL